MTENRNESDTPYFYSERTRALIAKQLASNNPVDGEILRKYNADLERMGSVDVIGNPKTEEIGTGDAPSVAEAFNTQETPEDVADVAHRLGREELLGLPALTSEEEIELSRFRTTAGPDNQMPTDNEEAEERRKIIRRRQIIQPGEMVLSEMRDPVEEPEFVEGTTGRSVDEIADDIAFVSKKYNADDREARKAAFQRLEADGVDVNKYVREGLNKDTLSPDDRKEISRRKRALNKLSEDMKKGAVTEEQEEIMKKIGLDPDDFESSDAAEGDVSDSEELESDEESKKEIFYKEMFLLLMNRKQAEERSLEGDRRIAIKHLESQGVDVGFIFGEDIDEDDTRARIERKNEVRKAFKAMRSGEISEDEAAVLRLANIDINEAEVRINPDNTPEDESLSDEASFHAEYGCSKEVYDRLVSACLNDIFANGVRDDNQVLNNLTNNVTGEWTLINRGRRIPVPTKIIEKLRGLQLESWIGVANIMNAWGDLKEVDEINPSNLKAGLFMPRYVEEGFAVKMEGVMFPQFMGAGNVENYKTTERVENVGENVSKAMKKLMDYFGQINPDMPVKLKNDYWSFISSESSVRAGLYEGLGINRYEGEAAFAFLLSNFMIAKKGVGLDSFSILVKPAEKRLASYEVDEARDPIVRLIVQESMHLDEEAYIRAESAEKQRMRIEVLKEMRELIPSTFIPTGLDIGGEAALSSGEGWVSWRNRTYISAEDRKMFIEKQIRPEWSKEKVKAEKSLIEKRTPPASDIETRLSILRSAIDVHNSMKAALAPEADVSKIAAFKGKLFIHLKANLLAAGYPLEMVDFIDKKSESDLEWISKCVIGVAETYLYTHSIADSENRNGKPWSQVQFIAKASELFDSQAQSGKHKYIGLDAETASDDVNRFVEFVNQLYEDSKQICGPLIGITNIAKAALTRNHGIPNWYGRYEDLSEQFKAFLQSQVGYEGQWSNLQNKMKKITKNLR